MPLLIGDVKDDDVVKEISEPSFIDFQQKLIWFILTKTLYIWFFSLQFYALTSTSFKLFIEQLCIVKKPSINNLGGR